MMPFYLLNHIIRMAIYSLWLLLGYISFIRTNCIVNHQLGSRPNPCLNHTCKYQAWCIPNSDFSLATCVCYTTCFDVGDSTDSEPVCGTNLKQYPTFCHLRREACTLMVDIGVKYHGLCSEYNYLSDSVDWKETHFVIQSLLDPCAEIICPPNQVCNLDEYRQPKCKCQFSCDKSPFQPVCGSTGKTYRNVCLLRLDSCQSGYPIDILSTGVCPFGMWRYRCGRIDGLVSSRFLIYV